MNSVAGCSSSAFTRWMNCGGVVAVDDAVIEGRRQVHHLAHDDVAVAHDRALDDRVGPDDRDFRMIDHRRGDEAAERAEAGDGDGRAGKIVARGLAVARELRQTRDFGCARPRGRAPRRVRTTGTIRPFARLRGDADMHGRVAMHDAGFVVEARVDLRIIRQHMAPARASGTAARSVWADLASWSRSDARAALPVPSCRLPRHRRSAECGAWLPACFSAILRRSPMTLISSSPSRLAQAARAAAAAAWPPEAT